jgi:hypothetical protein
MKTGDAICIVGGSALVAYGLPMQGINGAIVCVLAGFICAIGFRGWWKS